MRPLPLVAPPDPLRSDQLPRRRGSEAWRLIITSGIVTKGGMWHFCPSPLIKAKSPTSSSASLHWGGGAGTTQLQAAAHRSGIIFFDRPPEQFGIWLGSTQPFPGGEERSLKSKVSIVQHGVFAAPSDASTLRLDNPHAHHSFATEICATPWGTRLSLRWLRRRDWTTSATQKKKGLRFQFHQYEVIAPLNAA